jgi:hypothetical protein
MLLIPRQVVIVKNARAGRQINTSLTPLELVLEDGDTDAGASLGTA